MNPYDCPVRADTAKIKEAGKELMRQMRRLRLSLNRCETCELLGTCEFRRKFNAEVDSVIQEILEEHRHLPEQEGG